MTSNAGRKRAQRMYSSEGQGCCHCGSTESLHRHHKDHDTANNARSNIEFLCASCHGRMHAMERWEGHSKVRQCLNCGVEFIYQRARQKHCSRTCGNKTAWKSRARRKA